MDQSLLDKLLNLENLLTQSTHPVNFPSECIEETQDIRQSVDLYSFHILGLGHITKPLLRIELFIIEVQGKWSNQLATELQ